MEMVAVGMEMEMVKLGMVEMKVEMKLEMEVEMKMGIMEIDSIEIYPPTQGFEF